MATPESWQGEAERLARYSRLVDTVLDGNAAAPPKGFYRVMVRTPDDPDDWTAIGYGPVGSRYQYISGDVAVIVDFGND